MTEDERFLIIDDVKYLAGAKPSLFELRGHPRKSPPEEGRSFRLHKDGVHILLYRDRIEVEMFNGPEGTVEGDFTQVQERLVEWHMRERGWVNLIEALEAMR